MLFLIFTINQILDIKMMKGKSFIIKLGTKIQVNKRGVKILTSEYLKIQLLQINLK